MVEGSLKQLPIYFVSKALNRSKLIYSEMENMVYVVVMAARKLRHYFQSFKIKVPTSFPLRDMFENREASGRIGKWATLLASHPTKRNHVSSLGRFCYWLDTINTFAEPSCHWIHLAVRMWWSLLQEWFRRFGNSHSTFGNSTQVRS